MLISTTFLSLFPLFGMRFHNFMYLPMGGEIAFQSSRSVVQERGPACVSMIPPPATVLHKIELFSSRHSLQLNHPILC